MSLKDSIPVRLSIPVVKTWQILRDWGRQIRTEIRVWRAERRKTEKKIS